MVVQGEVEGEEKEKGDKEKSRSTHRRIIEITEYHRVS